jgi:hypothetical protein
LCVEYSDAWISLSGTDGNFSHHLHINMLSNKFIQPRG